MHAFRRFVLVVVAATLGAATPAGAADALTTAAPPASATAGAFTLSWTGSTLAASSGGRVVWDTAPGVSFVRGGTQRLRAAEQRGSFSVDERIESRCTDQTVETITAPSGSVVIRGRVSGDPRCESDYLLRFREVRAGHLQFTLRFTNPAVNLSELVYASDPGERIYGFGEQFSILNMKGQQVPIISQEGGVGRGLPIVTDLTNLIAPGSGGSTLSTYDAVPHYLTSSNRSLMLENTEYSVFDLRDPGQIRARVFSPVVTGRILAGTSLLELIERFTEYSGRMRALPNWLNEGAVIGVQGGTAKVNGILDELGRRGTPLAGVWMQDWVGRRQTALGSQLWWNWELDKDLYPNWDGLVGRVEQAGGKVLCYVNPMLVDATPKGNVRRNLYTEAVERGYLVHDTAGKAYQVTNTDFAAGLLDLTNPAAVTWIKAVIKDQVLGEAKCRGWMHDYAEALPFDGVLASGESAASYHNRYPVEWARIAKEAIAEAGLSNEVVFFNRSGSAKSPGNSQLFWEGDQLVTWDAYDGLRSAVLGLMTGGLSGVSLNHSDIGGYTGLTVGGVGLTRENELLLRWIEYAAFTPVFRTHEGIRPAENEQFYSSPGTYDQFDRFARVYKALAPYRRQLMREAQTKGWPLVRHPMLEFPGEAGIDGLTDEFMLGSEFLVAPVVDKDWFGIGWRKVYFPDRANTTWVHALTGQTYGKDGRPPQAPLLLQWLDPAGGSYQWVPAPIGTPPVFYRKGSAAGAQFRRNLAALGVR